MKKKRKRGKVKGKRILKVNNARAERIDRVTYASASSNGW
jgi:hypothetical protein